MSNRSKQKKPIVPLKYDFACGRNKQPGYIGIDLYSPEADHKIDLLKFPLPWKDGVADEIFCSHFIEHIPNEKRWPFFEECWRILKADATMRIFVPNWKSERAYGDMTHQWPPVTAMFFFYLNRGWREANKLTYGPYALKCNFEHQAGAAGLHQGFNDRNNETQMFAVTHYLESFQDMWVTLTKKA